MRRKIAEHLEDAATCVVSKKHFAVVPASEFAEGALLVNPRYGEYARNSVQRYVELQGAVAGLSGLA